MAEFTPEKCKQIALARLDVVHKWLEFRKKSQNKLQADTLYNKVSSKNFCKLLITGDSNALSLP